MPGLGDCPVDRPPTLLPSFAHSAGPDTPTGGTATPPAGAANGTPAAAPPARPPLSGTPACALASLLPAGQPSHVMCQRHPGPLPSSVGPGFCHASLLLGLLDGWVSAVVMSGLQAPRPPRTGRCCRCRFVRKGAPSRIRSGIVGAQGEHRPPDRLAAWNALADPVSPTPLASRDAALPVIPG